MVTIAGRINAVAQSDSAAIVPSEEELVDELADGEIDYDTYLLLYDLLLNGTDSTQEFLLDEILTMRQRSVRVREIRRPAGQSRRLKLRSQFGGELKDSGRTKYRLSGLYRPEHRWSAEFGMAGEYSGNERILRRSLVYTGANKTGVARVTVGSYRARFGLGTVVGYRGKLLDYSNDIDGESFLFPDYGGFNGILGEGEWRGVSVKALGSLQRDSSHYLATTACDVAFSGQGVHPGIVGAVHQVRNRFTSATSRVYQVGAHFSRRSERARLEWEVSGQTGDSKGAAVALSAGRRWRAISITSDGWSYGKEYLGLSAGSKAASLGATDRIEAVDFDFSNRRGGQNGGRLRSEWQPGESLTIEGDLLYARRTSSASTTQTQFGVERRLDPRQSAKFEFLWKESETPSGPTSYRRRGRAVWSLESSPITTRAAISFADETVLGQYWSLAIQITGDGSANERWQVWSNWRRVKRGTVEAWHGTVSYAEDLAGGLRGVIRFTDGYDRARAPRHSPSLLLELQAQL